MKKVIVSSLFDNHNDNRLSKRAIKNGYYSSITQVVKFLLSTTSTIVLARLLTPDDYGLIAMVAVFINLADMFKDAGLSMATVQKDKINQDEISGLFWVNVIISLFLTVLMAISAPLIVAFYGRSELSVIVLLLSISFFISGITIQHNALLQRLLRYDLIGVIQILSQIFGLIAAIFLAISGFQYMAIVINALIVSSVMSLLTLFYIPWIPSCSLSLKKIKGMLVFGGDITGFNVINYFSRNGDNILIGKYLGPGELGIYSKAYQIFMMPVNQIRIPINSVTIPVLSRLQDDPEKYNKYCSLIVEILAIISMPLTLICYLESDFIVTLMLGDGWGAAIPVFKILALYGVLQVVLGIRGSVMVSMGLTRRYFWMGTFYAVVNVIAFIIGIQYGIIGVATAYVIVQYILFIPSLYYSLFNTPFKVSSFFKSVYPQVVIALILILFHLLLKSNYDWNPILSISTISVIVLTYITINYLRLDFRNQALLIIKQVRS
jgi:O-antigen/teichoic acid export membrane protein